MSELCFLTKLPPATPLDQSAVLAKQAVLQEMLGTAAELSVRSFQWVSPGRLAHVPAQAFSPLPDPVMKCSPAPGRGTAVLGIPACTPAGLTSSAPGRHVPASRGPGRKRDQRLNLQEPHPAAFGALGLDCREMEEECRRPPSQGTSCPQSGRRGGRSLRTLVASPWPVPAGAGAQAAWLIVNRGWSLGWDARQAGSILGWLQGADLSAPQFPACEFRIRCLPRGGPGGTET